MSTPNFSIINAKDYYVVMGEDAFDYEIKEDDLFCKAKEIYKNAEKIEEWNQNRSYPGSFTTQVRDYVAKSLIEIAIKGKLGMTSGYYQHATLDYEIEVYCEATRDIFTLSDYDGDAEAMVRYMFKYYEDNEDWRWENGWVSAGLFKMNKEKIIKAVVKGVEEMIENCENICKSVADNVASCVGVFSNGEAIYEFQS